MMDVTGVPDQCRRYWEAAELVFDFSEKTNHGSTNVQNVNINNMKTQTRT